MYQDGQNQIEQYATTEQARHFSDKESVLWSQFAEAENVEHFCRSWLALQCRLISGVRGALVLLGTPDKGPYSPVAVWPDVRQSMEYLTHAAERALKERRGLLLKGARANAETSDRHTDSFHVAYPLMVDDQLHGVIVLDVQSRDDAQLQAVLRQLHWGSAWLEVMLRRQQAQHITSSHDKLVAMTDLVASAIEHKRFYQAALTFVTELAGYLNCDRVSIGFVEKNAVKVVAISHSAQFEKKSNLVTEIGLAMDEAVDQRAIVVYPHPDTDSLPVVTLAHQQLAHLADVANICTIPLFDAEKIIGAITFERNSERPFEPETIELCETLAALASPVLEEKRLNDSSIFKKNWQSLQTQLHKLVGYEHTGFKLVATLLVALLLVLIFVNGDYRVTGKTVIEGQVQRVVAAPFASYIAEAQARAGDVVEAGQVLARLDDKDLQLERLKVHSQKEQLLRQYREAMAQHDRAQIRIHLAQISQVNAQLDLLNYQLARMALVAPFKGVLVTGDLSQSLGAPVEKGEVLYEIAPLDAYRIIIQVDERDIGDVQTGQTGILALSSIPNEEFTFTVEKITPVSTVEDGRNYFRVEATLEQALERMRPGMEGVGKINIEERRLIWIWTHKLINWFRLWIWSWWP